MKKNFDIVIMALVPLFFMACNQENNVVEQMHERAITFGSSTDVSTRAVNAEDVLNKSIVVFGNKQLASDSEPVFNGTSVTYDGSTGWTYTELKYWDNTAENYAFTAYSLGNGDGAASPSYASIADGASINGFTLSGTKDQLLNCYFTNKQVVESSEFNQPVNLVFNQMAAKVCIGFWEKMDGYSVKDVKFYSSDAAENPSSTAVLYAGSKVFPNGGSYNIDYDSNNKAQFTYSGTEDQKSSTLTIGSMPAGNIGKTLADCTKTSYATVLPTAFSESIYIHVTYTLVKEADNTTDTKSKKVEIKTKKNQKWDYQRQYTLAFEVTLSGINNLLMENKWDEDSRH